MTGWWFHKHFLIFHFIYGIILPIDELIFFRGIETTNQYEDLWATHIIISSDLLSDHKPVISMRVLASLTCGRHGHRFHSKFTKFSAAGTFFDRKGEIWGLRAIGGTSHRHNVNHGSRNPSLLQSIWRQHHFDSHRFTLIHIDSPILTNQSQITVIQLSCQITISFIIGIDQAARQENISRLNRFFMRKEDLQGLQGTGGMGLARAGWLH